jgi:hypothetical protein
MSGAPDEAIMYLDLETGQVVMVTDEISRIVEEIGEDVYDQAGEETVPFDEALRRRELDDWMVDAVREAWQVEEGFGTRFIRVPQVESHDGYRDMEQFIHAVSDTRVQDRLWRAIQGSRPFRRFKDTLLDYPQERERWFEFEAQQGRRRALEWLEDEEIEPIDAGQTA